MYETFQSVLWHVRLFSDGTWNNAYKLTYLSIFSVWIHSVTNANSWSNAAWGLIFWTVYWFYVQQKLIIISNCLLNWSFIVDLFCFISWSIVPRVFLFQFCVCVLLHVFFNSIITWSDNSLPSVSICITICLFSVLMPCSPFCSFASDIQLSVSIHVSNSLCISLY